MAALIAGLILLSQAVTFGVTWTIQTPTTANNEDHLMPCAVGGTSDYTLDATMRVSIWQDDRPLSNAATDYDSSANNFGPESVNPGSPPNNDFDVGPATAKVHFFGDAWQTAAPLDTSAFNFI